MFVFVDYFFDVGVWKSPKLLFRNGQTFSFFHIDGIEMFSIYPFEVIRGYQLSVA